MKRIAITLGLGIVAASAVTAPAQAGGACWGEATAVFAQMGEMGMHSADQPNPRVGLRNLARALAEAGVIPDDSMDALAQFVADSIGFSLDACLD